VKKTFWLREFVHLLRGEHCDVSQALEILQFDGHLTLHLVTQLIRTLGPSADDKLTELANEGRLCL